MAIAICTEVRVHGDEGAGAPANLPIPGEPYAPQSALAARDRGEAQFPAPNAIANG